MTTQNFVILMWNLNNEGAIKINLIQQNNFWKKKTLIQNDR